MTPADQEPPRKQLLIPHAPTPISNYPDRLLGEDHILFDCGPATTHKLAKVGLLPTQIDYLFFTHHHFDHDVDYPCFLLTRWDQSTGKEKELEVYGPTPTETLTHRLLDEKERAFAHDWIAHKSLRYTAPPPPKPLPTAC